MECSSIIIVILCSNYNKWYYKQHYGPCYSGGDEEEHEYGSEDPRATAHLP